LTGRTPLAVLLGDLYAAGLRLPLKGGRIAAAPSYALTPDLRERLRRFREDVIEGLREEGEALLPMFAYGPDEVGLPEASCAKGRGILAAGRSDPTTEGGPEMVPF